MLFHDLQSLWEKNNSENKKKYQIALFMFCAISPLALFTHNMEFEETKTQNQYSFTKFGES